MEAKQLNPHVQQDVQYCVPLWLRDEQIKQSSARIKSRIQANHELRDQPVALVCYGPSLNDTWERLRDFEYIMTCSGAHKFLLDRKIIPTWHAECDPRAHKVGLLGPPHPTVDYLLASTCHPKLFDHLEGYKVTLWHVYDTKEEGLRLLPPNEWAITGGCGVGLRTLKLARFFGFRDLHIFGMDGCAREARSHAASHPLSPPGYSACEYKGRTYFTTPAMLEAARGVPHELKQLVDVRATFYGDGLVQDMMTNFTPPPPDSVSDLDKCIGFIKPELISTGYRDLNIQLHHDNLAYGVGGSRYAKTVQKLLRSTKAQSVLDYGCGKGLLAKALPFPIWEYDPAVPGKTEAPRPADLVICTDVLEHVEPDKLLYVLADLQRCARKIIYFTINTQPSTKCLADGRNAHLILQNLAWWKAQLEAFFTVPDNGVMEQPPIIHIVAAARQVPAPGRVHVIPAQPG